MIALAIAVVAAASAFGSGGPIITTFAGTGILGNTGDGDPATSATFHSPAGVAVDGQGNVYISDAGNHRVRKVDRYGIISNYAGTGTAGSSADNVPAASAQLDSPGGLAVDGDGSLYIADAGQRRVRKVDSGGTITTVAGTGQCCFSGDYGQATLADLSLPHAVALDGQGDLYIADPGVSRVRKVDSHGFITTFAGDGSSYPPSGDGGQATFANVNPLGVAADGKGNVYIADTGNNRVRQVDPNGFISTFAGTGMPGGSGDGGLATSATLNYPAGVAVDTWGNLYIYVDCEIREVSGGTITRIAGTPPGPDGPGCGYSGDGGPATSAKIDGATAQASLAVVVDALDDVYIADYSSKVVRLVDGGTPRPKGATPLIASLVPAYQPCGTGNTTHGAPLSHPSCGPPAQASSFLTVGTPDSNGAHANAIGSVVLRSVINPTPTANDLLIKMTTTDVRCKVAAATTCGNTNAVAGRDYTGRLQGRESLRVTDNENGLSTIQDFPFTQVVPCSGTTDTSVGATCSLTTSANALMPGMAKTGERAIWELGQIQLYDGGSSGTAGASDATLFEDQGVFVP